MKSGAEWRYGSDESIKDTHIQHTHSRLYSVGRPAEQAGGVDESAGVTGNDGSLRARVCVCVCAQCATYGGSVAMSH